MEAIDRIIISTNNKFRDQFEYWTGLKTAAGFKKRIDLIVEPSTHNRNKLGSVRGIAYAIKEAKVEKDLLIIFGDNFYTFDLGELLRERKLFNKTPRPGIVAYDIGSLENAKTLGVLRVKEGRVVDMEEKPEMPSSSLIGTGIYFFPKSTLTAFDRYVATGGNTDGMGFFFKWLLTKMEIEAIIPTKGEWFDIGTLDGYKELFQKKKGKYT